MISPEDFRVYLITPPRIGDRIRFYRRIEEALSSGIRSIQFRNVEFSKRESLIIARRLRELTREYGSILIINDEIDLVLASGADGVHLGQADFPIREARKILGAGKIIGLSTHSRTEAEEAEREQADYIGFGAVFPTASKKTSCVPGLPGLEEAARAVTVPVIAIGGISLSNIGTVFEHGASGVALLSAIWDAPSLSEAVRLHLRAARPADSGFSPGSRR